MPTKIDVELIEIVRKIESESRTLGEWKQLESDDMFQSKHFVGGFDADEEAFCFSYYDDQGNEFWFQMTIDEIGKISRGEMRSIYMRPAG